ncbi:hypothetical protein FA15DRAFT_372479 [Coprinopsis marcescibilis]|uniref:Uncharacterized protein n=1 Tax=Coprinopsis marcescibilis TaxID=230819 RepID=A0A5C3KXA8_COPMA|nr:hypothetical protein FA15DRAFT_372479 [Coprinopsis marcescibilis]
MSHHQIQARTFFGQGSKESNLLTDKDVMVAITGLIHFGSPSLPRLSCPALLLSSDVQIQTYPAISFSPPSCQMPVAGSLQKNVPMAPGEMGGIRILRDPPYIFSLPGCLGYHLMHRTTPPVGLLYGISSRELGMKLFRFVYVTYATDH